MTNRKGISGTKEYLYAEAIMVLVIDVGNTNIRMNMGLV